jgi:dephospho-CoA kinase
MTGCNDRWALSQPADGDRAMFVLGLTGSIAMGKSTAAETFRSLAVPVLDADLAVHGLLAPGGAAVGAVIRAFPGCEDGRGGVDRRRLGQRVFEDPAALARLEAIVHPLVRAAQRRFLARCAADGEPLAVLDIPLLLETGVERLVDAVAVVSAPALLQRQRALRRPGMSSERLQAIRARQMPDEEKRRRADFVISTGLSRRHAVATIARLVDRLRGFPGRVWPARWPVQPSPRAWSASPGRGRHGILAARREAVYKGVERATDGRGDAGGRARYRDHRPGSE